MRRRKTEETPPTSKEDSASEVAARVLANKPGIEKLQREIEERRRARKAQESQEAIQTSEFSRTVEQQDDKLQPGALDFAANSENENTNQEDLDFAKQLELDLESE